MSSDEPTDHEKAALPTLLTTTTTFATPTSTTEAPTTTAEPTTTAAKVAPASATVTTAAPAPPAGSGNYGQSSLPAASSYLIATTLGDPINAFESPTPGSPIITTVPAWTDYGVLKTFLVIQQRPDGWLEVFIPGRPNGGTGWIRLETVGLSTTTYEIRVSLGDHRLDVLHAGATVLSTPVVVGAPDTPTPVGTFFITDPIDLHDNPHLGYGVYALGTSAYSNVWFSFGGGPGQIGIHGTDHPELVGQSVSNGCIRVPNDAILQIAGMVPVGTPVRIA